MRKRRANSKARPLKANAKRQNDIKGRCGVEVIKERGGRGKLKEESTPYKVETGKKGIKVKVKRGELPGLDPRFLPNVMIISLATAQGSRPLV